MRAFRAKRRLRPPSRPRHDGGPGLSSAREVFAMERDAKVNLFAFLGMGVGLALALLVSIFFFDFGPIPVMIFTFLGVFLGGWAGREMGKKAAGKGE
jgi:hypothetical protein